jgi:hypothetical protein
MSWKKARVQCAKLSLITMHDRFENAITGDETWFHFYEPNRKQQNNVWQSLP